MIVAFHYLDTYSKLLSAFVLFAVLTPLKLSLPLSTLDVAHVRKDTTWAIVMFAFQSGEPENTDFN